MDSTDRKIVFNHFYGLRHDLKRVIYIQEVKFVASRWTG